MVDIVHHGIIGVAGAGLAASMGQNEIAIGFMVGSLLPDLDVLFIALGKSRFLKLHQGVTHSVVGVPLLAAVMAWLLHICSGAPYVPLLGGVIVGMALHVVLDVMNTFGVRLFWPSARKLSLDAFFFVDIPVLAASCITAAATWMEAGAVSVVAWSVFVMSYAASRIWWKRRMMRRHGLTTAVPSGAWPLTWFVTKKTETGIAFGTVSGFWQTVVWNGETPQAAGPLLDALRNGPVYADLERSLKLFVPVSIEHDGDRTIVTSKCVAVPNFGNRYGETRSVIVDGKVIHEDSRI